MANLETLALSGLYGKSAPEAAALLIARGIEELQEKGRLPRWYEANQRK